MFRFLNPGCPEVRSFPNPALRGRGIGQLQRQLYQRGNIACAWPDTGPAVYHRYGQEHELGGGPEPFDKMLWPISSSGVCRLRWISSLRALSGETYRTCVSSARLPAATCRSRRSMAVKKAANVLPDPVGTAISVLWPATICGQPHRCASVDSPNRSLNHVETAG